MNVQSAEKLTQLPPYLFVEIDQRKDDAIRAGRDVIDFGVGDPDTPTPQFIIDRMSQAIADPGSHTYAFGIGSEAFRQTIVTYFHKRFGVSLDPQSEVVVLLGSKEGIGHLPIGLIDPGDVVLVPEPGYPVYVSGTIFAGGTCRAMPLTEENHWLPDLAAISPEVARRAKILWLNYPNNPTGACAPRSFFEEAIAFAREYDILIAQDAPYCELYLGEEKPQSILEIDGARDVAVEFHSFSKTFNMTGWRLAFAVGNQDALRLLAKVKSNLDSGVFKAVQAAGMEALSGIDRPEIVELRAMYRRRLDVLANGLRDIGWPVTTPEATFYLWAKCPDGLDSREVCRRALDEADVVVIPGAGFGKTAERFVRFSLTQNEARTREAVERLAGLKW